MPEPLRRDEYLAWQKATASRRGAMKFVKEAELYAHKVHVRRILRSLPKGLKAPGSEVGTKLDQSAPIRSEALFVVVGTEHWRSANWRLWGHPDSERSGQIRNVWNDPQAGTLSTGACSPLLPTPPPWKFAIPATPLVKSVSPRAGDRSHNPRHSRWLRLKL